MFCTEYWILELDTGRAAHERLEFGDEVSTVNSRSWPHGIRPNSHVNLIFLDAMGPDWY